MVQKVTDTKWSDSRRVCVAYQLLMTTLDYLQAALMLWEWVKFTKFHVFRKKINMNEESYVSNTKKPDYHFTNNKGIKLAQSADKSNPWWWMKSFRKTRREITAHESVLRETVRLKFSLARLLNILCCTWTRKFIFYSLTLCAGYKFWDKELFLVQIYSCLPSSILNFLVLP